MAWGRDHSRSAGTRWLLIARLIPRHVPNFSGLPGDVLTIGPLLDRTGPTSLAFPRAPLLSARLWEAQHASRRVSAAVAVTAFLFHAASDPCRSSDRSGPDTAPPTGL